MAPPGFKTLRTATAASSPTNRLPLPAAPPMLDGAAYLARYARAYIRKVHDEDHHTNVTHMSEKFGLHVAAMTVARADHEQRLVAQDKQLNEAMASMTNYEKKFEDLKNEVKGFLFLLSFFLFSFFFSFFFF